MRALIVLIFLIHQIGCATVGQKIDQDKVTEIQEGITTEKEVVELLGSPFSKTMTSDGKIIMMYLYTKVKNKARNFIPIVGLIAMEMDMRQQTLSILIGKDGTVEKYTMNDYDGEIKSGLLVS